MRYLITGGAGFIGSHIAELAIAEKHTVAVLDDLSNGVLANVPPQAVFYEADIRDDRMLASCVRDCKPDVIFHEAAQPSLRYSIEDPAGDALVNILGTLNVIAAAKQVNAHVVFASTSAVYAPDAGVPFLEDDLHAPNLPYGIAKHSAELYLRHSGVSYTILRYGNVYGPRQAPIGENQLVPHCIRFLQGKEPEFAINGDGEQRRDFVYVKDVARANLNIGGLRSRGVYNVGTGIGTSVNRVCMILAELAGYSGEFAHRPAKKGEARDSILATKSALCTGWAPRVNLARGLEETWNYAQAHE